jgi:hypothetical protein
MEIQLAQGWTDENLLDLCLSYIQNTSTDNDDFPDWLEHQARQENKQFQSDQANEFIEVEYDTDYFGGDYSNVGETAMIPTKLAEQVGMGMAFRQTTGFDPAHIIHYNPDERYDSNGNLIEEDD